MGGGGGSGEIIYPSLHCHHQNDLCIKTGSNESHFNVSSNFLIVRDKVTRQGPQTTAFEEKGEAEVDSNRGPSANQPNALPLGQTGSQCMHVWLAAFTGSRGTKMVFGNFSLLTLRVRLVLMINLPYGVFLGS